MDKTILEFYYYFRRFSEWLDYPRILLYALAGVYFSSANLFNESIIGSSMGNLLICYSGYSLVDILFCHNISGDKNLKLLEM